MLYETEKPPNKHTIAMGELVRKAREEAGLSQEQLAEKIYRKRLAVSELENGKVEISAWTVPLLAASLDKPISYFFPSYVLQQINPDELTPLEQELLIHFRNISNDHLQKVAINQVRVLGEFDPSDMILDDYESVKERRRLEQETKALLEKRHTK